MSYGMSLGAAEGFQRPVRSSGSLYTGPCLIDCLLRSRSIHTMPRRLSAHSYRVAPADHPVAVPEKYGI